jgi:hypothetical protein
VQARKRCSSTLSMNARKQNGRVSRDGDGDCNWDGDAA